MRVDGFSGPRNWFIAKGEVNQMLSPEVSKAIQNAMGFNGIRVLSVESGIKIDINHVLKEIDQNSAGPIYQHLANLLGVNLESINSVLVIVGGLELAKEYLDKIKKSLKKIGQKKANQIASELGIIEEDNALIFIEDGVNFQGGGLILIETGMKEIRRSIKNEEDALEED